MIKFGEWNNYEKYTKEEWIESGNHFGHNVIIKSDVRLCTPVHISSNCIINSGVSIDKYTYINWNNIVYPNVYIGSYCSIARNVQISIADHPLDWLSTSSIQYTDIYFPKNDININYTKEANFDQHPKTVIGSDVWIGTNVSIKAGVKIGHGAIIGAGAVVTKNVEPYAIVGGCPARVLRYRFEDHIIEKLIASKWWCLPHSSLKKIRFQNIENAIEDILKIRQEL